MKTGRATGMKMAAKYLRLEEPELLKKTYESSIDENKLPMKRYPIDARFGEEFDKSGYIDSLYKR